MKIDKFKIEEFMNKYESLAKYDFTTTCIAPLSLKELFSFSDSDVDIDEFYNIKLDYGYITGSSSLKNNIAALYQNQKEENVTITLGAIGANALVFYGLIEKDDEVISIIPTYQQHYSIPKQLGANVKLLKLNSENNWHINLSELQNLITPKTKLITLNNPNNPTGSLLEEFELNEIVKIADKVGAYILSDEVYRFLNHNKKSNTISIADIYDKGISTFSMSKTFSLAGIRVGAVIADMKIIDIINQQRQYNTISVSALDDYVANFALKNKDKIIERNLDIILKGKLILENWAKKQAKIKISKLEAGTTAFLKYQDSRNSYDFSLDLFKDTGVLVLPGDTMEIPKHIRIGYCGDVDTLQKGLKLFGAWLNKE